MRVDTNSRLKVFYNQKDINLIINENIKEEYLAIKKLNLNRKGNSVWQKFIKFYWMKLILKPIKRYL